MLHKGCEVYESYKEKILTHVAFMLVLSMVGFQGINKIQAKTLFFSRMSEPSISDYHYYSDENTYYKYDYGMPNCTAYAWGRAFEILNEAPKLSTGMANEWYDYNKKYHYYTYGTTPRVGSVMCWNGDWGGHVAIVEKIDGKRITISNSSYGGDNFYTQTDTLDYIKRYYKGFQGFIYLGDFTPALELAKPKLNVKRSDMNYTLQWNKVNNAAKYQVDVCKDATCELMDTYSTTTTSFTKKLSGKPYWVRVHAQNGDFDSVSNTVSIDPTADDLLGAAQNMGTKFYAQLAFGDVYVRNVNHKAILGTVTNSNKGIYEFAQQNDGSYLIKDIKTNELLTSKKEKSNTNLLFAKADDTKNQTFFLHQLKNGIALQPSTMAYAICNVKGGNATVNTPIQISEIALSTAQSFTLYKGGLSISGKVNSYKGNYDGKAHSIAIQNIPAGSTITYRTSTKNAWSTKKPTRTNAGTTTVYYNVTNPRYEKSMSGKASITIQKIAPKATVKGYDKAYDGKKHSISITKTLPGSTIYYRSSTKKVWSKSKPTRTTAGTTNVYYKITNANATKTLTGKANICVRRAVQKSKIKGYSGTYNGKKHTISITKTKAKSTIYYRTSTKKKWSKTKPTRTSVGTTKVYYKIVNANYKDVTGSASIVIKKKR